MPVPNSMVLRRSTQPNATFNTGRGSEQLAAEIIGVNGIQSQL